MCHFPPQGACFLSYFGFPGHGQHCPCGNLGGNSLKRLGVMGSPGPCIQGSTSGPELIACGNTLPKRNLEEFLFSRLFSLHTVASLPADHGEPMTGQPLQQETPKRGRPHPRASLRFSFKGKVCQFLLQAGLLPSRAPDVLTKDRLVYE